MNSAAKLLHQSTMSTSHILSFRVSMKSVIILVLSCLVFLFSFATVFVTNQIRVNYHQLQSLQQEDTRLHEEWGQLLLEKSAWSTQARVQRIAVSRVGMVVPQDKGNIVIPQ